MQRGNAVSRCGPGLASRFWLRCPHQPSAPFAKVVATSHGACAGARGFRNTAFLRLQKGLYPGHRPTREVVDPGSSDIAFAFDIDGVLTRGKKAIPGAAQTLRALRARGIPYILLTNGGGTHEDDKIKSLAWTLRFSEDEDVLAHRVVLSHTPMRGWPDSIKRDGTVLITGSNQERARKLAKEYGFRRVVTPADLITANESIYPFASLRGSLHSRADPLPDGKKFVNIADPYSPNKSPQTLKIDQIFVWNDPRDWSLDTQVIYDLLISHKGYLGTISPKNGDTSLPNNGWQQDGQPELWISNLDLLWKTDYPINRFGTGAFVEALGAIWTAATGGAKLQYEALGKPSRATYEYAHDRLLHYRADLAIAQGAIWRSRKKEKLRRIYMIGDNPESDIRGANEFDAGDGSEWLSILVGTGVWRETPTEKTPKYAPDMMAGDVVDAVLGALKNEGVKVDRATFLAEEQR